MNVIQRDTTTVSQLEDVKGLLLGCRLRVQAVNKFQQNLYPILVGLHTRGREIAMI